MVFNCGLMSSLCFLISRCLGVIDLLNCVALAECHPVKAKERGLNSEACELAERFKVFFG